MSQAVHQINTIIMVLMIKSTWYSTRYCRCTCSLEAGSWENHSSAKARENLSHLGTSIRRSAIWPARLEWRSTRHRPYVSTESWIWRLSHREHTHTPHTAPTHASSPLHSLITFPSPRLAATIVRVALTTPAPSSLSPHHTDHLHSSPPPAIVGIVLVHDLKGSFCC